VTIQYSGCLFAFKLFCLIIQLEENVEQKGHVNFKPIKGLLEKLHQWEEKKKKLIHIYLGNN